MKRFFFLVLLVASTSQASLQIDADYDLPNGAHKKAKLFLVDKDLGEGHWISLPATPNYKVKVQAIRRDERVDLKFRISEKNGAKEKLLAAPSVSTRLGHSAEITQGRDKDHTLLRLRATPSDMEG